MKKEQHGYITSLLIFLMLIADYTACYIISFIWRINFIHFMIIVFLLSVIAGAYFRNIVRSILLSSISLIGGMFIAWGILALPSVLYGGKLEVVTIAALPYFMRLVLFGGLASTAIGGLIGSILNGGLS